jgi:hypothetical protein
VMSCICDPSFALSEILASHLALCTPRIFCFGDKAG